jgi:anti-anti-sigma factor
MEFVKGKNVITIFLEGEINSQNSSALQKDVEDILAKHSGYEVIFDADKLTFLSSAGLKIILSTQKKLGDKTLTVTNVSNEIYEIFEMTRFTDLMNIEKKSR